MMISTYRQDRYPGLRSFDIKEGTVFFGRTEEKIDLLDRIRTQKTTILFGKSGYGKSSLLNAGLHSELIANRLYPVRVRFQLQRDAQPQTPLNTFLDRLKSEYDLSWKAQDIIPTEGSNLPSLEEDRYCPSQKILFDELSPKLWEQVKIHELPNSATPIFIFDQFEEFFAYDIIDQTDFLSQLAELTHDQPPSRIIDWLLRIAPNSDGRTEEQLAWCQQPAIKCIFVIRSDRLYQLDHLEKFIPLILRNKYELNPLKRQQAIEALVQPAKINDPAAFTSPTFEFNATTVNLIIDSLSNSKGEIECSQLQMICNHVENSVKKISVNSTLIPYFTVNSSILPNREKIEEILEEFYENQLKTLPAEDYQIARTVIEDEFVESGQRVGVASARLSNRLGSRSKYIIEQLQIARLIRPEETDLGLTFELSHDTLVVPVERAKQQRQQKERVDLLLRNQEELRLVNANKRKLTYLSLTLGAIALLLAYFMVTSIITGRENLTLYNNIIKATALQQYELGRFDIAYRLLNRVNNPGKRFFAPFMGRKVLVSDEGYVAVKYSDNTYSVFKKTDEAKPVFVNILYERPVAPFTRLWLAGHTLVLVEGMDNRGGVSRTTIINLKNKKTLFRKKMATPKGGFTSLLSPNGLFVQLKDTLRISHLYRVKLDTIGEISAYADAFRGDLYQSSDLNELAYNSTETRMLCHSNKAGLVFDFTSSKLTQTLNKFNGGMYSPTGHYLTIDTGEEGLIIYNANIDIPRFIDSLGLPPQARRTEWSFNQNESTLVVLYELPDSKVKWAVHIQTSSGIVTRKYQVENGLCHMLPRTNQFIIEVRNKRGAAKSPSLYEMTTGQRLTFPASQGFGIPTAGQINVLLRDSTRQHYVYNLLTRHITKLSDSENVFARKFAFLSDKLDDQALVVQYDKLVQLQNLTTWKTFSMPIKQFEAKMIEATLINGMVNLSFAYNPDLACFLDSTLNTYDLLGNYGYPALSKNKQYQLLGSSK